MDIERRVEITNPTFLQPVDFRCYPHDTGEWDHFNTFDGIPGIQNHNDGQFPVEDVVFQISKGLGETLWLATQKGISRYRKQRLRWYSEIKPFPINHTSKRYKLFRDS